MIRMIKFGYRSLVLGDVKDEYEDLARFLGVTPFRIGPGLPGRINPLDLGPLGLDWDKQSAEEQEKRATVIFNRWLMLIRGLVASQGVVFSPTEERVINKVLRHLTGWSAGASRLKPITIRTCGRRSIRPPRTSWPTAGTRASRRSTTAPARCATP